MKQHRHREQGRRRRRSGVRRAIVGLVVVLAVLLLGLVTLVGVRYGGGSTAFPDRTSEPQSPGSALEVVAELPTPPGNIAVAPDGRVFFTLHPEARPELQLVEWTGGAMRPWPSLAWQGGEHAGGEGPQPFHELLSVRIDNQNRLWTLDTGRHGLHRARLLAFDLDSGALMHEHRFAREVAGLGSHMNDFQVSPDGRWVYISDASFFAQTPAVVVYDTQNQQARRAIENHDSVEPDRYIPVVQGRVMKAFGLVAIRPGVDGIALSHDGAWLYFAPITDELLYRVPTGALRDSSLSPEAVAKRIEAVGPKTMTDGMTMDAEGNLYLSDLEHSAIVRMAPDGSRTTLIKTPRLRWPDGFSFGPDGWLYVTASSLHHVIGKPPSSVEQHAPYHVFRFRPGVEGRPGH